MGHHDHRDPGRLLRTRRRRETPAGEPVRQPEDVGAPAAPGHPGGAAHGGTDHAAQRLARGDPRSPRAAHHRTGSGRGPGRWDLVGRQWQVSAPNLLLVADFTYAPMACGFGYTAFVVDAYAGLIPGWECSLVKDTGFVERALRHAVAFRAREGHPFDDAIHHSDAGSQYTAIHYGETLMLEGLQPSVGTVGDALDNALCETTIGLYKTECIRDGSPFRNGPISTQADLEDITSAWVAWYNERRLMHRLRRRPPAEAEAEYYARLHAGKHTGHT